jgi:GNAT superfamily N-acetyltransferase
VRTVTVRILGPGDADALEAFLVRHRESSMFLRFNSRNAGLVDRGEFMQATYAGEFAGGELVGVASHSWSGMVLVQAPLGVEDTVRACVQATGRAVKGFNGLRSQVRAARRALGLEHARTSLDEDEGLYALDLGALVVPPALTAGTVGTRPARTSDHSLLHEWRVEYGIEILGESRTPAQRQSAWEHLEKQLDRDDVRLATVSDAPVSMSAFNASLPDIVQLGGIYTPPELRGRGYARVSVAASLLCARERGADRAVLFTGGAGAVRVYEGLGFRRIDDWALVLF